MVTRYEKAKDRIGWRRKFTSKLQVEEATEQRQVSSLDLSCKTLFDSIHTKRTQTYYSERVSV